MPPLFARPCSGGCGAYVPKGRCPACRRKDEAKRLDARRRGYGPTWKAFRLAHILAYEPLGLPVICGASLPQGPNMEASLCRQQGLYTYASRDGSSLQLHHDPALEDWERQDSAKVCDHARVGWLCAECHARETRRTQHDAGGGL